MISDTEIGQNVANLRKPLNQTELANAMRGRGHAFHQQTIQRIESGERPLRLSEAATMSGVLGATISALLGEAADARMQKELTERAKLELVQDFQEFMLAKADKSNGTPAAG